jgi:MFS family permease
LLRSKIPKEASINADGSRPLSVVPPGPAETDWNPAEPVELPLRGIGRTFVALRVDNYRYYWAGQMVSLIGTWMQTVSQPWLVLLLGGTPFQLGLVLAFQFAPALVLAPISGVLADRIDKRRAIMFAQVLAMVQAVTLFAITVTGVVEIWHVMALAALLGTSHAIESPFRQSFAAELVPREYLMNAIALSSASFNFARVVGPAIAGVTLAAFGPATNFGINSLSSIAVLIGLARMDSARINRNDPDAPRLSIAHSLVEGVAFAVRTPFVLWPLVLLTGIATFAMNFQALLPVFARDDLRLGAVGYGALFATMGVGSLCGSLSLAFLGTRRPVVPLLLAGSAAFVVTEVLLGIAVFPWAAFPLVLLVGFFSMVTVNTINASIQHSVTHAVRGRVMSLYVLVLSGSTPFGGLFAGSVAERWGAPVAFIAGAALAGVFVAIVAFNVFRGRLSPDAASPVGESTQAARHANRP